VEEGKGREEEDVRECLFYYILCTSARESKRVSGCGIATVFARNPTFSCCPLTLRSVEVELLERSLWLNERG
jgi:hypothetical protein